MKFIKTRGELIRRAVSIPSKEARFFFFGKEMLKQENIINNLRLGAHILDKEL